MRPLLLIAILILAGCYGQGPAYYSYEGMQILAQRASERQCAAIASQSSSEAVIRWATSDGCRSMRGGSGTVPMVQMYNLGATQYSTIGQPDQFGPLGYRGPTWERYNQFFNNPPQQR
jgi:hypothetical protein